MQAPATRAVTIDLWGTLLLESPMGDEHHPRERLIRIAEVLAARNIGAPIPSRARGYEESRGHLLSVLLFSDECGICEPDPGIFPQALRPEARQAGHVGDDPRLDVEDARVANMQGMLSHATSGILTHCTPYQ